MTAAVEGADEVDSGDVQGNCGPTQYLHLLRHRHPKISRRKSSKLGEYCPSPRRPSPRRPSLEASEEATSLTPRMPSNSARPGPNQASEALPPPRPEVSLNGDPCDSLEALCLRSELLPCEGALSEPLVPTRVLSTPLDPEQARFPPLSGRREYSKLHGHGAAAAEQLAEPRSIFLDFADLPALTSGEMEKEQCPYCARWFSTAAAARHIPICSKVSRGPRRASSKGGPPRTGVAQASRSHPLTKAGCSVVVSGGGQGQLTPHRHRLGSAFETPRGANCGADDKRNLLAEEWGRMQLLLRKETVEALRDGSGVMDTLRVAEECVAHLGRLEDCARRLGMRKGQLSRLLLPFDSNTYTGDQASSASDAPLGSPELDGRLSSEERRRLVAGAVMLRRLVRVKLADCADIDQACDSLGLVVQFLRSTQRTAEEENFQATALLRDMPSL